MAESWDDLFVRTSLRDTGPTDRQASWSSPDILPVGVTPPNPASYTTAASYGRYYSDPLYENRANYILVRARNSSPTEAATAKVWTIVRDPAIVLWPEEGWPKLRTAAGLDHSLIEDVGPGQIGATGLGTSTASAPFVFTPDYYGHRCLVSWLSTARHPAPPDLRNITSAGELADFLVKNPNYAHQNIEIVPDTTGTVTRAKPFESGNRAASWLFELTVEGCDGFEVGFSCGRQLANGKFIDYKPTVVTQNDRHSVTIERTVEAGFRADISYFYDQRNNPLPGNFDFQFSAGMILDSGHPLFEHGRSYNVWDSALGKQVVSPNRVVDLGSVGLMKEQVK